MFDRVWEMVEAEVTSIVDANYGDGRDILPDFEEIYRTHGALVPMTDLDLEDLDDLPRDELVTMLIDDGYRIPARSSSFRRGTWKTVCGCLGIYRREGDSG